MRAPVFGISAVLCVACSASTEGAPPTPVSDATIDAETDAALDGDAGDASDDAPKDASDARDAADAAIVVPAAPPLRATTECGAGALIRLPDRRFASRLAPYAKGVVALAETATPTVDAPYFYNAALDSSVAPTGFELKDFSGPVFVANADGFVTLRPTGQLARVDYGGVFTLLPYVGPAKGATIQEASSDGEALWWTEDAPSAKEVLVRLPLGATVGTALVTIAERGQLFARSAHVHVIYFGSSVSGGFERPLLRVDTSGAISTAPTVAHSGTILGVDDDTVAWFVDSDISARRRDGTGSFRSLGKGRGLLSTLAPGAVYAVDASSSNVLARLPVAEGEASTSRSFAAEISAVASNGKQLFVGTSNGCVYSFALP